MDGDYDRLSKALLFSLPQFYLTDGLKTVSGIAVDALIIAPVTYREALHHTSSSSIRETAPLRDAAH